MAETGVLDQIDNDAAVAPLPAAPATESTPVNPFEAAGAIPIDTASQETEPATTADTALPTYEPVTAELTDDQLVSGNLDKILDKGGVLMDVARSAGDEYSNSRGMLNSSMGAESSMRAMIDSALPIAQQDAAAQVSQLQTNQSYENRAGEFNATADIQQTRDSILQSYQLQMENLSTNNKAKLIQLEQKYTAAIQSDKNASDVYISTMDSIAQLMSNGDLSVDQQNKGLNELIGMLDAYLDFNVNLNSVNSVTGTAATSGTDGGTQDRVDAFDLSATEAREEARVKIAEYDRKIAELGPEPSRGDYTDGSIFKQSEDFALGAEKWSADKAAIDGEYSQWLRYAENNPDVWEQ